MRRSFFAPMGLLTLCCLAGCGSPDAASSWNPLKSQNAEFENGLKAFADSKWVDAQKSFEAANQKEPSSEGHFDEGTALYKQQKLQDALDDYKKVLDTTDDNLKARAYFDIGNTQAAAGNLEEAKTAYRRALELRPDDVDAKYNIEWAQRAIEEKKKKEKEQQAKNDEKKDSKDQKGDDKKDQKDQDKKGPEQAKDDKKDQKPGQQDQKKDQQDQQQAGQDQKKDGADQDQKDQQQQQAGQDQKDQKDQQPKPDDQKQGQQQVAQAGEPDKDQKDDKNGTNRPLGKQETAAVLDALQQGEHPLQMWKFDEKDRKATPRSARDKPW